MWWSYVDKCVLDRPDTTSAIAQLVDGINPKVPVIMGYSWSFVITKNFMNPKMVVPKKNLMMDLYCLLVQQDTTYYLVGCISRIKLVALARPKINVVNYEARYKDLLLVGPYTASTIRLASDALGDKKWIIFQNGQKAFESDQNRKPNCNKKPQ